MPATATVPSAITPGADRARAFEEFLRDRGHGFAFDTWQIAAAMLLAHRHFDRPMTDGQQFERCVIPILANSAESSDRIRQTLQSLVPAITPPAAGANIPEPAVKPGIADAPVPMHRSYKTIAAIVALAILLCAGIFAYTTWPAQAPRVATRTYQVRSAPTPSPVAAANQPEPPDLTQHVTKTDQTIPRSALIHQLEALATLLLAVAIVALCWWRWQRHARSLMQQAVGDWDDRLAPREIADTSNDAAEASRLLRVADKVRTREVDPRRTAFRSARRGGAFTPAFRDRRLSPDLLVLIERQSAGDHLSALSERLFDELGRQGVLLQKHFFSADPRFPVAKLSSGNVMPISLDQLNTGNPAQQLIVVAATEVLLQPVSQMPWSWIALFDDWRVRTVLDPGPWDMSENGKAPVWGIGERRLTQHGWCVGTATAQAVLRFARRTGRDDAAGLLDGSFRARMVR